MTGKIKEQCCICSSVKVLLDMPIGNRWFGSRTLNLESLHIGFLTPIKSTRTIFRRWSIIWIFWVCVKQSLTVNKQQTIISPLRHIIWNDNRFIQVTYSICGVLRTRKPPRKRGNTSSAK